MEDRRPGANCDPYKVTGSMIQNIIIVIVIIQLIILSYSYMYTYIPLIDNNYYNNNNNNHNGITHNNNPANNINNCDPYKVTGRITKTTGECLEGTMDMLWPAYERKMKKEGLNKAAIDAFKYNFGVLVSGEDTMIGESALDPVESLTTYESLPSELKPVVSST